MNWSAILADLMLVADFALGCVVVVVLWTILFRRTIDRWQ